MLKDNRTIKKYSESFKLKVLSEIESGKYTKTEVCKLYNIGFGSLYSWIKKFDKFALMNKQIRIETMEEKDKIKSLEKEIAKLKEALVDKDLKLFVNECYLDVAREKLGYKDLEVFKKKLEKQRSKKQ
jgi:transposase-like protein